MSDIRLVLFDLDGTLITSYMENPDRDYDFWAPRPNIVQTLDWLREHRIKTGVITNQAGVGFGYIKPSDWIKKRNAVCGLLGFQQDDFFVCFAHPQAPPPYNNPEECRRRKPSAAMLFEAMEHFGHGPEHTIFVGDQDSDAEAARHARIRYYSAETLDAIGRERHAFAQNRAF